MTRSLQFKVLIGEDFKVLPFADGITKVAFSPQLIATQSVGSTGLRTRDLLHENTVHSRLSHLVNESSALSEGDINGFQSRDEAAMVVQKTIANYGSCFAL